jgi:hypothetical protein
VGLPEPRDVPESRVVRLIIGVLASRAGPTIMEQASESRPQHLVWLKECLHDAQAALAKFAPVGPLPASGTTYSEVNVRGQQADNIVLDMAQADLQAAPPNISSDTSEASDAEAVAETGSPAHRGRRDHGQTG